MTTVQDEVAALRAEVRRLRDRAEVTALCDRYVTLLDQRRGETDWLDSVFADDAQLRFPFGTFTGRAELERFQKMTGTTYERSHHLAANHTVDLAPDGETARVRGHLTAVHVRDPERSGTHYSIGGHYEVDAVRTAEGWRIRAFAFDRTWHAGEPAAPAPRP